ncbi:hypothetical protein HJG45_08840 [Roseicella sp. DB1501]|nr:hypothetical protein [Roseicella sp. DB1501]
MNQIDWNQVLQFTTIAAGSYVAAHTMQWVIADVIAPLVGLAIAWRVSSSYVRWKRAQAAALRETVPEIEAPSAPVVYISRARALRSRSW